MYVSDVRDILNKIKAFHLTQEGSSFDDDERVSLLLDRFTEERALNCDPLTDEDIFALRKVYFERWELIEYGPNAYTAPTDTKNAFWIKLAKLLSHGGVIDDYDSFLMPNITDVAAVRNILNKIEEFNITQPGALYDDCERASKLLERFTEERAIRHDRLSKDDIDALQKVYVSRWDAIAHGPKDYTACKIGQNELWIILAKNLAQEYKIASNYYRFLMPTLKPVDIEPVSRDNFIEIPLEDLMVNDDRTELFSIKKALDNADVNRIALCIPYNGKPRVFSKEEQKRIEKYKQGAWQDLKDKFRPVEEAKRPISKETVLAIKELAEASASRRGEINETLINSKEEESASMAYFKFERFKDRLTTEEKEALSGQIVRASLTGASTFEEEYLKTVTFPEAHHKSLCTTLVAEVWASLVMQYIPDVKFDNPVLEDWREEESWAHDLPYKKFANVMPFKGYNKDEKESENYIDTDYYRRSCLTLLIYVMSNSFDVAPWGGKDLEFRRQHNHSVPTSAYDMYNIILKAITDATADDANALEIFKYAYFKIKEYVVKPALAGSSPTRYAKTQKWLSSLSDESFWGASVVNLQPKALGARLLYFLSIHQSDKIKHVNRLIDDILVLSMQKKNDPMAGVELAIIANQLNQKFSSAEANALQVLLADEEHDFYGEAQPDELYLKEKLILRCFYYLSHIRQESGFAFFNKQTSACDGEIFSKLHQTYEEMDKGSHKDDDIPTIVAKVLSDANIEDFGFKMEVDKKARRFLERIDEHFLPKIEAYQEKEKAEPPQTAVLATVN
jgi:hypothetical protein